MDDGFLEWLQGILGSDLPELTDADIAKIGQWFMYQNLGVQQGELDYKNKYLDFQQRELGLRGAELDQAMREFEFKSGPYFDFYKENEIAKLQASTQMSKDDVAKSANYLQQQRYATEAAGMQRDAARFQTMQTLGLAPMQNQQTADPIFNRANALANRGY